jgi:hypothetical protein
VKKKRRKKRYKVSTSSNNKIYNFLLFCMHSYKEQDQSPLGPSTDTEDTFFLRHHSVFNSTTTNNMNSVTDHVYHEPVPTVKNWITSKIKNPKQQIKNYFLSFFPFLTWIYRYNLVWFWSDLIAGLTVGAVVIPQSMAYAGLANLAPQFGLYSSFVGVMIYWFFATSKVSNYKQMKHQYKSYL